MYTKEEKEKYTDRAWDNLYNRLEQDGLLTSDTTRKKRAFVGRNTMRWVAVAALFVGVVSIVVLSDRTSSVTTDTLVLHNAKGEPTLVTSLEDGSIIYLSEQASVEYPSHFAQDKREVSLQGDAFFEVSKNRERPFIIHTQTAIVEVLGTSFNIKNEDSGEFSLSVRSGKVRVTSKRDNYSVYVNAGETALLQATGLRTLPTSDVTPLNHYLRHILFKDQSLSDIIRAINENTDSIQLKLAPELSDKLVTIGFKDNTPEEMARIMCLSFDLELTKQQNILYINRRN